MGFKQYMYKVNYRLNQALQIDASFMLSHIGKICTMTMLMQHFHILPMNRRSSSDPYNFLFPLLLSFLRRLTLWRMYTEIPTHITWTAAKTASMVTQVILFSRNHSWRLFMHGSCFILRGASSPSRPTNSSSSFTFS